MFWDTCQFDSPPIYIPKKIKDGKTYVYGCFCSPECALSYLKQENLDSSTMWHRYSLLNIIYGEIYNYEKALNRHQTHIMLWTSIMVILQLVNGGNY